MLDGDKLVEFIGHATVNSPLDDFLKENGIKSRPKGNSGHYDIEDKSSGIYFSYYEKENYAEKYLIPQKSKGNFVLQGVIFRNRVVSKGGVVFSGKYPFGTNEMITSEDILKKFGSPRKLKDGNSDLPTKYIYSEGMLIFTFGFNHKTGILELVNAYAANPHDRGHGLID